MIEASQVSKRFGSFLALDRVSFAIEKGRIVALLGQNGAGKTTTLRILSSFLPPTSGKVTIDGADTVRRSDDARRRIGYLPERVPLYDDSRVEVYLRFRARLKGLRGKEVRPAVEFVLDRCNITARRKALISSLSKGLRQRVGIADAMIHRPAVLILDEPTSGLDPDQRVSVRHLIRELGSEHTVVVSTHILSEAEATCEDVLLIHKGRIRLSATMASVGGESPHVLVAHAGAPLPGYGVPLFGAPTAEDGRTRLAAGNEADAARAVAAIVAAGRDVLLVSPEKKSLESVFLDVTSRTEDAP